MHDKRRFPRLMKAESLSLTVIAAPGVAAAQGEKFYCESVDVSAAGLRVIADRDVAGDTRVEIWLVLLEDRETFLLQGKVSWCEPAKDEQGEARYLLGVQLLPVADSDFDRWAAKFLES